MQTQSVEDLLGEAAQRLWCQRMLEEGWRPGVRYDERRRVHDALVPYERLGVQDRRLLGRALRAECMQERLLALVRHERGPDRELAPEEMREGLRVGWAAGGGDPEEVGQVVSWELEGDELTLVRVRWADGRLSKHCPAERELRRLEEA